MSSASPTSRSCPDRTPKPPCEPSRRWPNRRCPRSRRDRPFAPAVRRVALSRGAGCRAGRHVRGGRAGSASTRCGSATRVRLTRIHSPSWPPPRSAHRGSPSGVAVTNPYLRHPAVTASAMASVAELSGGRAILGLGAGGGVALDPVGIARAKPLTRTPARRSRRPGRAERASRRRLPPTRGSRSPRTAADLHRGARRGVQPLRLRRGRRRIPRRDTLRRPGHRRRLDALGAAGGRALYPSVIFDGEDLEWARPRFIFAFLDTPASTRKHAGLSEDEVRQAVESFEQGDDAPARRLITDDVLANLAIIGDHRVIASPAGRAGRSPPAVEHRRMPADPAAAA